MTTSLSDSFRQKGKLRRENTTRLAKATSIAGVNRNDLLPHLALETMSPDALRMPKRKLRNADAAHVRQVANSISVHGFLVPILVGRNNVVLDGDTRVLAARHLGLTNIPCVRISHLNDIEQRTARLAVNRLAEKGQWDLPALKLEFEELILLDTPLENTAFSLTEIDDIILDDDISGTEQGPFEPDQSLKAVSRRGDVFRLGEHRIICGDSTDPETLAKLMAATPKARLILTDEPYNVPIKGHVTSGKHRSFEMAAGEMSTEEFLDFNLKWMKASVDWLCDGGLLSTFIDWRGLSKVVGSAERLGLHQLNLIVWAKTNAGMGSLYRSQHELLPIFKIGRAPHVNNIRLGKGGRWRSNLQTYPGASSYGSDARRGLQDHPTVKPTAMLQDLLHDLTDRGEIILDPFVGSGSTLIACEQTGRVCRGVEIDPLYIDTIIRRYQTQTGKQAIQESSGDSFSALERGRDMVVGPDVIGSLRPEPKA